MGIVVSSRQASNIFWHSVTCLNAICVLISSLQQPWPLEKKRCELIFPSLFPCLVFFICGSLSLPFSSSQDTISCSPHPLTACPLLFLVSPYTSVVSPSVQWGFLPTDKSSIYRFCALLCHLVSTYRQTHSQTDKAARSYIHFCPSAWRHRCTTCQAAVFLRQKKSKWTASKMATNETTGRCHFFFSFRISPVFLFLLWALVHWASRLQWYLFGSGIISHVYDT